METKVLIQTFTEFAKQKNVDRPTMIRILQDVFRAMIKKRFEHDENFDIVINADKGDLEIMRFREIVDDNSEDIWDFDKIKLSDAKKFEKDFEVGDEVAEEIKIEDFGRRAVILAKQTLIQRVKDLEKEVIISKYDDLVGEIISGETRKRSCVREEQKTDCEDGSRRVCAILLRAPSAGASIWVWPLVSSMAVSPLSARLSLCALRRPVRRPVPV